MGDIESPHLYQKEWTEQTIQPQEEYVNHGKTRSKAFLNRQSVDPETVIFDTESTPFKTTSGLLGSSRGKPISASFTSRKRVKKDIHGHPIAER